MKKFGLCLAILVASFSARANSLGVISDMESNLTIKIRGIVTPVDPDAIVLVNISVRKISTALPSTGMDTLNFFGADNRRTIESSDIDAVKIEVYSALDPFPADIQQLIENSLKLYSKKGELKIAKLDPKTTEIFKNRWETANKRSTDFKRLATDYSERSERLIYVLSAAIGLAILIGSLLVSGLLRGGMGKIATGFSEIKIEGGGGAMTSLPAPTGDSENSGGRGASAVAGVHSKANIDDMNVASLQSLFVDSYWCEKDQFANWMWTQISPSKKSDLLNSWAPLANYVEFFSYLQSKEERYHNDPYYLGEAHFQAISNTDLLTALRADRSIWAKLSSMRRETMNLSLKERLELRELEHQSIKSVVSRAIPPSKPRYLPAQIEVRELTEEDELLIFEDHRRVGVATARRLPSWAWVALLPKEERASVLNLVSAQALAESWVGPATILDAVLEVIPEKKRVLFEEYRTKTQPRRNSSWLRSVSESAISKLDFTKSGPDSHESQAA